MLSRLVKIRLLAIGIGSIGALCLFYAIMRIFYSNLSVSQIELAGDEKNSGFSGVVLKAYDNRGEPITVKTDQVCLGDQKEYILGKITTHFIDNSGNVCVLSADHGVFQGRSSNLGEVWGNVQFKFGSDFRVNTSRAAIDLYSKIVKGTKLVSLVHSNGLELTGIGYAFNFAGGELQLHNSVHGKMKDNLLSSDRFTLRFCNQKREIKTIFAYGAVDFVNKSYKLLAHKQVSYDVVTRKLLADGEVALKIRKPNQDITIYTEHLDGFIDKIGQLESANASGSLRITTANATIKADRGRLFRNKLSVFGHVVISGKQGVAAGKAAVLDMTSGEVVMQGTAGVLRDENGSNA